MDRINQYRQIVQEFLIEFAQKDGKAQLIFDQTHDRYLVMHNEWREDYRIYGCAIQLDIYHRRSSLDTTQQYRNLS
jgi:hypothetical protein